MREYISKNSLTYNPCGKVVVSKNDYEDEIIQMLHNRGIQNNCEVNIFKSNELTQYEPAAKTNNLFLWSPNTWSASPIEILNCLLKEVKEYGVKICLNKKIIGIEKKSLVVDNGEKINFDFVVNSAGAYAIEIAKIFGLDTKYRILPFKGLYLKSIKKEEYFKSHIYPVPNIKQPFLGIHTTITSDGFLKLGPTAIPVFSPENYSLFENLDLNLTPKILLLQINLLLNNTFQFRDLAFEEYKYLFKKNIIDAAQTLTSKDLKDIAFEWYSPGIRAQLYDTELKKLENDIVIESKNSVFHLLNSISPAWTCSLKTAQYVLKKIKELVV